MNKLTCSLVLLALLGLGMVSPASADDGRIVVYFDAAGTQRTADVGNAGDPVIMYVYGQEFPGFINGAEYSVDYGPNIQWLGDSNKPPVTIGFSPTGISTGFSVPVRGSKFLIHTVLALWVGDCSVNNVNGPTTAPNPITGTMIVTQFPAANILPAGTARTVLCPFVEMDIKPGSCPNALNAKTWHLADQGGSSPSKLAVAILGSDTFDASTVDPSTCSINGVPAAPTGSGMDDVATADGEVCGECPDLPGQSQKPQKDGYMDLTLKFNKVALAGALPEPVVGDYTEVTLIGETYDGIAFEATDCIKWVGLNRRNGGTPSGVSSLVLGYPTPNPFNPVTRINYSVPTSQHVRIAIFDVAGRLVEDLVNETKGAGEYVVEWDAGRLPSGVYFYRMQTGDQTIVRRATLLK